MLFGYDTGVISGAIEPLTAKFGLSDFMKARASDSVLVGCAAGVLLVGPVIWVILAEIFPTAVRGRALGLATFFLWTADHAVTQTFPMMDEKDSWFVKHFNHAFPFYAYAAFCLVLMIVVWRFLPETKGRSLGDIERNWKK